MNVYLGLRFDEPVPLHYWRVVFCERFGWTFKQFDELSVAEFQATLGVWDGIEKARPR